MGPKYILAVGAPSGEDLEALTKLVEEGQLRAVVDRVYSLEDVRYDNDVAPDDSVLDGALLRHCSDFHFASCDT